MTESHRRHTVTRHTDTDTETDTGYVPSLSFGTAAPSISENQRAILARIGRALKAGNVPPLDRGLRSIVAQQVRNLLKGGWGVEEISHRATELALDYDRVGGHHKMTSLQGSMERSDEERQEREHIERMAKEKTEPFDPLVLKTLGLQRAALPAKHSFLEAGGNTCRICRGPLGVHVNFS